MSTAADWFESATPCDDDAPAASTAAAAATSGESRKPTVTFADRTIDPCKWLSQPPPPATYLARDVRTGAGALPDKGVALLAAGGGAGKGQLLSSMALAFVVGRAWLGVFEPTRPLRILWLSCGEDPPDELRRRLHRDANVAGVQTLPPGAMQIVDCTGLQMGILGRDRQGGHRRTEAHAALVAHVAQHGPFDVTLVDTFPRFAGVPIDVDNSAATEVVGAWEAVGLAGGGLVLGTHHTSQAARRNGIVDETALRGATALSDSARLVMTLTAERIEHGDDALNAELGEVIALRAPKANHVRRWDPVRLRRRPDGALVPLDSGDEALLANAQRPRDREAERSERSRSNHAEVADVIRALLREHPGGLSGRSLHSLVVARRGSCSRVVFDAALASMGGELAEEQGPRRSTLHSLREAQP